MPKLGVGLNLSVPRVGAAAPSGLPVATTNAIVLSGLTGGRSDLNGTYTKSGDPANVGGGGVEGEATGAVFFNSAYTGGDRNGAAIWYGPILFGSGNGWQITWYNDNRFPLGSIVSADTTTVPVSGYSNDPGYTGTITLTAAIPVSTTTLSISGGAGFPANTFTKATGNTDIYTCYYQTGSSDPTTKYTFNHLWAPSTFNGNSEEWQSARLGVATRKQVGGSGYTFISGSNCSGVGTEAVAPTWVLFYNKGDEYGPFMTTYATNPSQDFNNVPTTGWVSTYEIPSVNITAA